MIDPLTHQAILTKLQQLPQPQTTRTVVRMKLTVTSMKHI